VVPGNADPDGTKETLRRRHPGALVQAVADGAASNELFVRMVCAQCMRARRTGALLAKKPEVDLLLRLAGTTQITAAIDRVGARKGLPFLIIVTGTGKQLKGFRAPRGWKRLARGELTVDELARIEAAALLNALRG
jgi:tRNA threonylcarbamoyladenosine modification (KEOPS) complex Cgi121 subunit